MSSMLELRTAPPSLAQLTRRINDVSTLPQVALRVMRVAEDPNATAADLKAAMEIDAPLCARVLRSVNSSAYALRTKITNLQQAVAYLGMKQVRNLAMTASVSRLFKHEETIGRYRRRDLWRHLVATGICARLIATRLKLTRFEDVFLAGLLHDVGLILEDQYVHQHFVLVLQTLDEGKALCEIERQHLGFDHTTLGWQVAESWGFPDLITDVIRHHHRSDSYEGEHRTVIHCVELANLICSCKGMSSVGFSLVRLSPQVLRDLSLNRQDLSVLAEDLDREIQRNSGLFDEVGAG
ncbi:MAG: HDOD domain-containing protein [Thermoguttaceae bacterium]|jgi:putative nucleotidyltransferase with HDIG domain|nr:HDOD domain-containing protein [Thermoguttaceae bacterium]